MTFVPEIPQLLRRIAIAMLITFVGAHGAARAHALVLATQAALAVGQSVDGEPCWSNPAPLDPQHHTNSQATCEPASSDPKAEDADQPPDTPAGVVLTYQFGPIIQLPVLIPWTTPGSSDLQPLIVSVFARGPPVSVG